jgi:gliding motility-associated-like protein
MNVRLKVLLLSVVLLISNRLIAQVDTEFWFAPPEITQGHGDNPLFLRLSTLDQSATVRITQPARSNLLIAQVTIPANTTQTVNLTSQKTNLETIIPASVMMTGLKIESTSPITAYYEVGSPWNSDIFTLKGKNSLGNKFIIPGQDFYNNSSEYSPTPTSSFDIVATSNNTVVKVRPSQPIFGHVGDTLIVIKLNAGETYSFRKLTTFASDNPIGTIVESTKPIAITLKDDSVINGGCRDMLGDQLVPVEVAGTEYVVLRGFLTSQEYIFVTAIEDDTDLFFNDSAVPRATLRRGQVFRYAVTTPSTYIRSGKAVYVFHVTGFGCEMGMAILPSINCKGSTQIGFSRTTDEFFGLNILVRKEGIAGFRLNGSTALVPASAFTSVPGSQDKWYTAQLSFSTGQIAVGQASLISNTGNSFQIGIINGNAATTCKYGYFSAFSTLFIGDDFTICQGQTTVLDAGPDKESYEWNTGATSQRISVSSPGNYWVKIVREECVLYDTITVDVRQGHIDIVNSVSICPGESTVVDGKENFSWRWSNGGTDRFLRTSIPGRYWVSVFDYNGCQASDTVLVLSKPLPLVSLGNNVEKCSHDTARFDVTYPSATYLWSDGTTSASNQFVAEGNYWVKVFLNGCSKGDTVNIENLPGPLQDSIYGSPSVCPLVQQVDYSSDEAIGSTHHWMVDGGTIAQNNGEAIRVDWGVARADASVKLLVIDGLGCHGDTLQFPVRINPELIVEIPIGPDTLCVNQAVDVIYSTPPTNGSIYHWNLSGGDLISGQGSSEVNINWREGLNSLFIEESSTTIDTVCTGVSESLSVFVFRDLTELDLYAISVDTVNSNSVHVSWNYQGSTQHHPIQLYRRMSGETSWQVASTLSSTEIDHADDVNSTAENAIEYYIQTTNACDELLATAIHQSIRLTGVADSASNTISLSWNEYFGWTAGVSTYELWRKLDGDPGYSRHQVLSSGATSINELNASDAFAHQYVVRALSTNGLESWSNPMSFQFDHPIYIPNIFTPNQDDKNEFFTIRNISLYRNSVLTIVDRWGKKVYQATGYQNDWNGGDASTGIYFYTLYVDGTTQFKGMVSIFR